MDLLTVECEDRDDSVIVRATGDIDSSTVAQLAGKLSAGLQVARDHPARLLVVDLQAVTFFGSAGLNAVLDCHEDGVADGTLVRLVANNAQVVRPIEVTGLDRVLEVYPTMPEALRRCRDSKR
ncbi:MAG: STAS domain-containing protein [Mycobacterium sp.]|uniref:STAS domain-containing protein n=1 Tax=Mycobacterium sp. TaxID=1785 RepID=UPI003CC5B5E3